MVTKVQKRGNSQSVRLTRDVLKQAQIGVGDKVNVSVRRGRTIVEPLAKVSQRYRLKELVARIPKGEQAKEIDWGQPVGKETW